VAVRQRQKSGPEANAVKLRASEDAIEACERAVRVHGGMGYAREYDVERYWREVMINVLAPISNEMVKTTSHSTSSIFRALTGVGHGYRYFPSETRYRSF